MTSARDHLRMRAIEGQRDVAAEREPADDRARDAAVPEQRAHVGDGEGGGVLRGVVGALGLAVAPHVPAMTTRSGRRARRAGRPTCARSPSSRGPAARPDRGRRPGTRSRSRSASLSFDHLVRPEDQRLRDRETQVLAVLRLTASSNVLGSSIGRSPGLAPFRMRSTSERHPLGPRCRKAPGCRETRSRCEGSCRPSAPGPRGARRATRAQRACRGAQHRSGIVVHSLDTASLGH